MKLVVGMVMVAAACGDDASNKLPDAPAPPDGSVDAPLDAPVDAPPDAPVMITTMSSITTTLGSLCGVAFDTAASEVLVYPCSSATIHRLSTTGTDLGTIARPGEAADDVDLDVAPAAITLGTTAVPAGTLVFGNGESGVVELYAPALGTTVLLAGQFGASHVVGMALHPTRGTVFVVQDRVPGATDGNVVAELDAATGAVLGRFSTLPAYEVNYGDLDVCGSTGNLFVVSSNETTIAEITPTGTLIAEYALPADVTGTSGIALEGSGGAAWVSGTSGVLRRLVGLPCP